MTFLWTPGIKVLFDCTFSCCKRFRNGISAQVYENCCEKQNCELKLHRSNLGSFWANEMMCLFVICFLFVCFFFVFFFVVLVSMRIILLFITYFDNTRILAKRKRRWLPPLLRNTWNEISGRELIAQWFK